VGFLLGQTAMKSDPLPVGATTQPRDWYSIFFAVSQSFQSGGRWLVFGMILVILQREFKYFFVA
jgi:hypothetical protein